VISLENNYNEVCIMEELRKKLEELILIKGTADEEVLKLSQELDNYIVNYCIKNLNLNYRQAV
jgi:hypothetical protein